MKKQKQLKCVATGNIIVSKLIHANQFLTRLRGLWFRPAIQSGEGILISPCQQVHTHFMGYPIDVVFLDEHLRICHVIPAMSPWKISAFIKQAKHVLELPAGAATHFQLSQQFTLSDAP